MITWSYKRYQKITGNWEQRDSKCCGPLHRVLDKIGQKIYFFLLNFSIFSTAISMWLKCSWKLLKILSFSERWQFLCCGHFGHFWSLNPCSSHDLKFKSSHNLKFKSSYDEDAAFHPISTHLTKGSHCPASRKSQKSCRKAFWRSLKLCNCFHSGG